ncbi:MAG: thioredoxin domain-containing protein [Ardenticatenaceae bacterium]|nr:thioredoxin domain-containing protein [Ardenticatenaceae bacterium]
MNRLAQETSPYLLQHAENPVDWYPWGDEAFEIARSQDKPILLSIGYAACHWCHVMAHESFEDEQTASLMNQYFVNVKVDREERPDVDQIYMSAVVAMTRQGGWPMTVAMTPEGKPFFGGTYFPDSPRHGMPSFQQVLMSIAQAWQNDRAKIEESADGITNHISQAFGLLEGGETITNASLERAAAGLAQQFDRQYGGFSDAPKFPQPMNLEFLLRRYLDSKDEAIMGMIDFTLTQMAQGGMYDQIGGGFARYSVDARWLVPHFEKMLYDNSQLARLYLHAWQVTGNPLYKRITEEILDYVLREMTHEDGGFYSSLDADSEGEEGKFYVWTLNEWIEALGEDHLPMAVYFDITAHGNWEGKNIPNMPRSHEEAAAALKTDPDELAKLVKASKLKLYEVRSQRVWPGLDDKVLTAWNGLMLAAFAEAGRVLERPDYTAAAVKNGEFLYRTMRTDSGRLLRTWKAGHPAKYNAYLEDYAFLADGLLALYQTTFDERWFVWARTLADQIIDHFHDAEKGGFFDTSDDHEGLIFRPKDTQDNAIPSGNAAAVTILLQLSLYTGEGRYWDIAQAAIESMYGAMVQYPSGFGQWLTAAALMIGNQQEIAIMGKTEDAATAELLEVVQSSFQPYHVVAVGSAKSDIPLLQNRPQIDGRPTAYVCQNFACQTPTTDPAELQQQMKN